MQCSGIFPCRGQKTVETPHDDYLFEEHAERVYNPFSLLSALNNKKFMEYWFGTGTPTFLVKLMVRENVILENLGDVPVRPSKLTCVFPMKKWNAPFCRNCCHAIPAEA